MRACARFAAACLFGFLAVMPRAAAGADLVILTNQGATPGVKELAAAFERASGHKVTVIQVEGDALEQRIASGSADLVTANPVSYTHLRAHETLSDLVCRLLLEKTCWHSTRA